MHRPPPDGSDHRFIGVGGQRAAPDPGKAEAPAEAGAPRNARRGAGDWRQLGGCPRPNPLILSLPRTLCNTVLPSEGPLFRPPRRQHGSGSPLRVRLEPGPRNPLAATVVAEGVRLVAGIAGRQRPGPATGWATGLAWVHRRPTRARKGRGPRRVATSERRGAPRDLDHDAGVDAALRPGGSHARPAPLAGAAHDLRSGVKRAPPAWFARCGGAW